MSKRATLGDFLRSSRALLPAAAMAFAGEAGAFALGGELDATWLDSPSSGPSGREEARCRRTRAWS